MNRALYSMIQFTTVTLLYSFASSLGDFQYVPSIYMRMKLTTRFLYIDLFVIIPIAVASKWFSQSYWNVTDELVGRTLPYPKIHPKRPTASLVSKKVLTSIIGQILINSAVQIFVFFWVRREPWYVPLPLSGV
jgi:cation-transporting ATPase 13A2